MTGDCIYAFKPMLYKCDFNVVRHGHWVGTWLGIVWLSLKSVSRRVV